MDKTYTWKVPETFYSNEDKEENFLGWLRSFCYRIRYVIGKEIREKLDFDDYNYLEDNFSYAVEFRRNQTSFVLDFEWVGEEDENIILEVLISVIKFKKFIIFRRKYEPHKEVFEEFNNIVLTIAKQNMIEIAQK